MCVLLLCLQLYTYVCGVNFRHGQCIKDIHEYFSSFEYVRMGMLCLLYYIIFAFGALALLIWQQEGHLAFLYQICP